VENIENHVSRHLNHLHTYSKLDEGLIHPTKDLRMLPFWIGAEIIYGKLDETLKSSLESIISLRESIFWRMIQGGLTRFSVSQYLPIAASEELRQFTQRWYAFNDAAYYHALTSDDDLLIIQLYRAMETKKITKLQAHQTIDEMLFANLDVTLGGISWNLVFLATNQRVQDELRAEVLEQSELAKDRPKTWEMYLQRPKSMLASCILESARLKPLAAFSVPQAIPTARLVSGYVMPAGTNFIVDSYAINVRNSFWGKDSTPYRPGRWMDLKTEEIRYNYWRYGFGPRTCMGKYVADIIIRGLLANLVRSYRLDLTDEMNAWDIDFDTWITHLTANLLCMKLP
jgi:gliotoxin/aspirochlorine/mycotoxins biosynthesis cytochrome P450 monooxygenase